MSGSDTGKGTDTAPATSACSQVCSFLLASSANPDQKWRSPCPLPIYIQPNNCRLQPVSSKTGYLLLAHLSPRITSHLCRPFPHPPPPPKMLAHAHHSCPSPTSCCSTVTTLGGQVHLRALVRPQGKFFSGIPFIQTLSLTMTKSLDPVVLDLPHAATLSHSSLCDGDPQL